MNNEELLEDVDAFMRNEMPGAYWVSTAKSVRDVLGRYLEKRRVMLQSVNAELLAAAKEALAHGGGSYINEWNNYTPTHCCCGTPVANDHKPTCYIVCLRETILEAEKGAGAGGKTMSEKTVEFSVEDVRHNGYSEKYRSGTKCLECDEPAGTAWTPHWCPKCDIKRKRQISDSLASMLSNLNPTPGVDK